MVRLGVPSVTCVIGEGGSGGAVAIAVADRVLMQENAIYSVISPEGCAAILWRDAGEAKKAAAAFKPDARHCLELGVVDAIVPEPSGGAHTNHDEAAALLADSLKASLAELDQLDPAERRRLHGEASFAPWASTSVEVETSAIHSVHRVIPVVLWPPSDSRPCVSRGDGASLYACPNGMLRLPRVRAQAAEGATPG